MAAAAAARPPNVIIQPTIGLVRFVPIRATTTFDPVDLTIVVGQSEECFLLASQGRGLEE